MKVVFLGKQLLAVLDDFRVKSPGYELMMSLLDDAGGGSKAIFQDLVNFVAE